jgi:hypothetical protein
VALGDLSLWVYHMPRCSPSLKSWQTLFHPDQLSMSPSLVARGFTDPPLASQVIFAWPALVGMSQQNDPSVGWRGLRWSWTADTRSALLVLDRSALSHSELCPSVAPCFAARDHSPHLRLFHCFIAFLALLRSQLCCAIFFFLGILLSSVYLIAFFIFLSLLA